MFHIILTTFFIINSFIVCSDKLYDNERKDRQTNQIVDPSIIIINYTTQPTFLESTLSLQMARASAHYIIDKNGSIYETLNTTPRSITSINTEYLKRRAWHAGHSYWKTDKQEINNGNSHSIGILFVNEGATPKDSPNVITNNPENTTQFFAYTKQQLEAFVLLTQQLKTTYNIDDKDIIGHGEVAINSKTKSLGRKIGPGPLFPWKQAAQQGIGLFHNLSKDELNAPCNITPQDMQELLQKWGYSIQITGLNDEQTQQAILQAQIHHDPQHIDGDCSSCRIYYILQNLLAQHIAQKTKNRTQS